MRYPLLILVELELAVLDHGPIEHLISIDTIDLLRENRWHVGYLRQDEHIEKVEEVIALFVHFDPILDP